jgi:8-oxo-dGTP pyrophosphatase MutT (NUDIX family)
LHRKPLLDLLARYRVAHPDEKACVDRVDALVRSQRDCFERSCLPGHITASAWLLSPDGQRFLLTHHRKLGRWLQLGGHADGDSDVAAVALREAREESGLAELHFATDPGSESRRSPAARYAGPEAPLPIDLDVHRIPARGDEPAHDHHDVRFVLVAAPGQTIFASDESTALEWFEMDALEAIADDESVLRLGRKVRRLLETSALRLFA